ncbi:MAG: GIY-YIG nuclease family protein [Saprospiraceae bacterium]|nr:GIY-YIG nuclease family protein [Saprospiraceae bacterium]
MANVYILYSEKLQRYYIGSTELSSNERLVRHNSKYYDDKFTARGIPWTLYFFISCKNRTQASSIEAHIKKMKSETYILNLKQYPEMAEKLLARYDF